jgi:hypothetical protein
MSSPSRWTALLLVVAGSAVLSCASSHAPKKWLDQPSEVPTSGYGGWIELKLKARRATPIEGEFLGVAGTDSVFVLTEIGFRAVPIAAVDKARVAVFQSQLGKASRLTLGGTILSLSHGLGFIISGPIWILVGSISAGSVSREPLHDVPSASWSEVAIYARYPQGLPAALDRATLRAKVNRPPKPIRVSLDDGRVLQAIRVEYSESLGYLTVETQDGVTEHIGANHVRSIVDVDGKDITKRTISR